jgi:hypothetical protein
MYLSSSSWRTYPLQGLVEEALREGGFETAILSSGEEALTLFRGRVAPYGALN